MPLHRWRSFNIPKAAPWSRYRDLTEAALDLQLTSMGITSFLLQVIILHRREHCPPPRLPGPETKHTSNPVVYCAQGSPATE